MTSDTPDGWHWRRIGDLGRVVTGKTPSTADPTNFGQDYPFITIPDLDGRVWISESQRYLSTRGAQAVKSSLLPANAVMMSCIATVGRCGITTRESITNQQINSVVVRDGTDAKFLYYAFTQLGRQLEAAGGGGSVYTNVSKSRFSDINVLMPPLGEQLAIAAVLSSLDNKIEQNRRTSQALEKLARATFKAWFVDFEPVKAKAAGATSFPGMPPKAFAALPTRLVDSPLGPVPEGWEIKPLSKACRIVSGGTPKRSEAEYWDGDIPWFSVKDAPSEEMPWVYFTDERITEAGLDGSAATLVPVGCTIISARGTVGRLALVGRPMTFNQSCYGLLALDGTSYRHLYLLLREVVSELQQRTHGSVFDTITRQTFDGVHVVSPPTPILGASEEFLTPMFDLLLSLLTESSKLSGLRDYLLPRLLSGSVCVQDQVVRMKST